MHADADADATVTVVASFRLYFFSLLFPLPLLPFASRLFLPLLKSNATLDSMQVTSPFVTFVPDFITAWLAIWRNRNFTPSLTLSKSQHAHTVWIDLHLECFSLSLALLYCLLAYEARHSISAWSKSDAKVDSAITESGHWSGFSHSLPLPLFLFLFHPSIHTVTFAMCVLVSVYFVTAASLAIVFYFSLGATWYTGQLVCIFFFSPLFQLSFKFACLSFLSDGMFDLIPAAGGMSEVKWRQKLTLYTGTGTGKHTQGNQRK